MSFKICGSVAASTVRPSLLQSSGKDGAQEHHAEREREREHADVLRRRGAPHDEDLQLRLVGVATIVESLRTVVNWNRKIHALQEWI